MSRQPTPGGDSGTWGTVLNDFLSVSHDSDGTITPAAITEAGGFSASLVDAKGDLIAGTANDTITRKAVGVNGASLVGDSTASDGLAWNVNPQWWPLYTSGAYYFCNSPSATNTSATLGNGTSRATPFIVSKAITITRLGAEFTVAGDANSVLRLGIYADSGSGVPSGAPVLDAGSISTGTGNAGTVATGGTPGNYEITISQALTPGLYWAAAAVQAAPGTQPTIRIINAASMLFPLPLTAIPGAASTVVGYSMAAAGALPTWSGTTQIGSACRIFFKVA